MGRQIDSLKGWWTDALVPVGAAAIVGFLRTYLGTLELGGAVQALTAQHSVMEWVATLTAGNLVYGFREMSVRGWRTADRWMTAVLFGLVSYPVAHELITTGSLPRAAVRTLPLILCAALTWPGLVLVDRYRSARGERA